MACKHKPTVSAPPPPGEIVPFAGESGMVVVTYTGWFDDVEYRGDVSNVVYKTGLLRRKFFADRRDLEYLGKVIEDGAKVFTWQ